jgi:hypothetical protein
MEWLHEWASHEYRLGSGSPSCFNASLSLVNVFARNRKRIVLALKFDPWWWVVDLVRGLVVEVLLE